MQSLDLAVIDGGIGEGAKVLPFASHPLGACKQITSPVLSASGDFLLREFPYLGELSQPSGILASMFEWKIETDDRGTVRLTGEQPDGYPCETWLNGQLLERSEDGNSSWDRETGVPSAVWNVDRMVERWSDDPDHLSYMLELESRGLWEKYMNDPTQSDAFRARTAAFSQYIRDKHLEFCGRAMRRFEFYD